MNLFIVLLFIGAFVYIACNIGSSSKPGHESYGFKPVAIAIAVCVVGFLLWPYIGPLVMGIFHLFGAFNQ